MRKPESSGSRYVISVLVGDRVGILRDISSALADMGANIDGISQTVVAGYFTVILTATFGGAQDPEEIRRRIGANFRAEEVSVAVRRFESTGAKRRRTPAERYVLTLAGPDRPGILKRVTTFLAEKQINVEDWHVDFDGDQVTHIGEVTVPQVLDIRQVQDELRLVASGIGLASCIQHENIFRVTNEVGAVGPLIRT